MDQIGLQAVLDDKDFQAGISRFSKGIDVMTSGSEKAASAISAIGNVAKGVLVVGVGVATAAIAAFAAASKIGLDTTMAWGESLDQLGDTLGLTGPAAAKWATAFQHVGLSVEEGAQQLNYFTRQLDGVKDSLADPKAKPTPFAEALTKLGVSAYDSKGKLKDFDTILPQIMDSFQKMPAGVNASALAMDLFGARGGSKFLDFLRQGKQGLVDADKFAKEFGLTMSTDAVNAIEEFGFSLNDTKLALTGLWNQVGQAVLPTIMELVNYINKSVLPVLAVWTREHMPQLQAALKQMTDWVKFQGLPLLAQLSDWVIRQVVPAFMQFEQWIIKNIVPAFMQMEHWIIQNVIPALQQIAGWILSSVIPTLQQLEQFIQAKIIPILQQWSSWIQANVIPALQQLGDTARLVKSLIEGQKWDTLAMVFWMWVDRIKMEASAKLSTVASQIATWFAANWDTTIKPALATWASQFWNWVTGKGGVLETLGDKLGSLIDGFVTWSNSESVQASVATVGGKIGQAIVDGVKNLFGLGSTADDISTSLVYALLQAAAKSNAAVEKIGVNFAVGIINGIYKGISGSDMPDWLKKGLGVTFAYELGPYGAGISSAILGAKSYDVGGTVPGPIGMPQIAIVHGGEQIIPVSNSRMTNNYFNLSVSSQAPVSTLISDFGIMKSLASTG